MHHQRTGLWPALVYAGCVGMANACYPFCWPVRICGLVNYSHPSSTKLAEACVCRSSSSDSPTARDRISPTIAVAATSRQTATEFFADIAAARREEAGFGIGARVTQALFLPVVALSFAAAPVVGQNFGGRRADRVRHSVYSAIGIGSVLMLFLTIVVWLAPAALIGFFSNDPRVIAFGGDYLRIVSFNFVAAGIVFTTSSVFQGIGNTWPPLISSMA